MPTEECFTRYDIVQSVFLEGMAHVEVVTTESSTVDGTVSLRTVEQRKERAPKETISRYWNCLP